MAAASHSVIINAPASAVYQVITDFESYPDFVPNQVGARVLSRDDNQWRVEFELSVAKKLRYTLDLTGVLDRSLRWTLVQGDMMKENVGGWTLEVLPDGRTQATYTIEVALGGFVPRSIANSLVARTLPDNLEAFKREVEQFSSPVSKAEVIANRLNATISERLDEDPVFYRKLGTMLKEAYEKYRLERLSQLDLLTQVTDLLRRAQNQVRFDPVPAGLEGRGAARTWFEIADEAFKAAGAAAPQDAIAELALEIDGIIERLKIVHWETNLDIQNRMRTEIEDAFFRFKDRTGAALDFESLDRVMDQCIGAARRRSSRSS